MKSMGCYLCSHTNAEVRHRGTRDNPYLDVLECTQCGLVYLSSFDHISDQFYEDSGMMGGSIDIAKYRRDSYKDDLRRYNTLRDMLLNKRILDFGCGAGGFLKLAADAAKTVEGVELDSTIRSFLNDVDNIPTLPSVTELKETYDVITLFHVLEHITDPVGLLRMLNEHLTERGKIIVEVPSANDALLTLYKSEKFAAFTYWSCHLYLFNPETLATVAKQANMQVQSIKQVQRYPISNHLYWLASGKPGGHQEWGFLNDSDLMHSYEKQLASVGKCDTLFAVLTR